MNLYFSFNGWFKGIELDLIKLFLLNFFMIVDLLERVTISCIYFEVIFWHSSTVVKNYLFSPSMNVGKLLNHVISLCYLLLSFLYFYFIILLSSLNFTKATTLKVEDYRHSSKGEKSSNLSFSLKWSWNSP